MVPMSAGMPGLYSSVSRSLVLSAYRGDEVQVEVEHGLPGARAGAVEQVHAVGTELCDRRLRDPLGGQGGCGEVVRWDVE